jgi:hypothetical protein
MATTALVVGTVASVAGTAYSAYGQNKAQGMQEDAMKEQERQFAFMNDPARMREMMSLFEGPNMARDILEAIGTGDIEDYLMNPIPLTKLEKSERRLFEESEPLFREVQQLLTGPIRDPLQELLRTGFRTDLTPIIEGEQHRLATQTAPALAERFAGALQGSGFENALAAAGGDLGMYLGEQQVGADEAAANRRMTGLQIAPGLFTAPLDLQTGYATAVGAAGQRFRERKESTRPGFRQLAAFPSLAGIEQGQGFMLPGYTGGPSGGGTQFGAPAANYSALTNSLLQQLPNLVKLFQTTTPTATPSYTPGPSGSLYDFSPAGSNPTSTVSPNWSDEAAGWTWE